MKTQTIFSLVVAAAFAVRAEDAADPRLPVPDSPVFNSWTSLTGQELVAEFVELRGATLVLRAMDGREHSTQMSNMTPESRILAQKYARMNPAPLPTDFQINARLAHENLMARYQLMSAANKDFFEKNEAVKLLAATRRAEMEEADPEIAELKAEIKENEDELGLKTAMLEAVYAADGELAELEAKLAEARKNEETILRRQINIIGARVRERAGRGQ